MMQMAVGYIRLSESQRASDDAINEQKKRIIAYAHFCDFEMIDIFVESAHAECPVIDRPELSNALSILKKKRAAHLIVFALRGSFEGTAEVLDVCHLAEKQGWKFHAVSEGFDTSTAVGQFAITILSALYQMELGMQTEARNRSKHKGES